MTETASPSSAPGVSVGFCDSMTARAAGRELVRRLLTLVDTGRPSNDPVRDAWVTVAFTYHGLAAT